MRKKIFFGFSLFIILLFSSLGHAISFPNLTGQIVDAAGILTPQTQEKIRTVLALSDQTVVVTIPSLEGLSIESYGYQLGRYWGIGNKNKDDGVLLLVAPNERSVRIEVGYGLEEILTDSISSTIIQTLIIPEFKKGDMNAGILNGTKGIVSVLTGKVVSVEEKTPVISGKSMIFAQMEETTHDELLLILYITILVIIMIWASRRYSSSSNREQTKEFINPKIALSRKVSHFKRENHFRGRGGKFGGGGASGKW